MNKHDLRALEDIREALQDLDTGAWQWDGIDACYSGKDSDLDAHGYQGIRIDEVNADQVQFSILVGKTVCGEPYLESDTIRDLDDLEYEFLREYVLEGLESLVCGCGMPGDWSGDDWFLTAEIACSIELQLNDAGTELRPVDTARAMIQYALSADPVKDQAGSHPLTDTLRELNYLHEQTRVLYNDAETNPWPIIAAGYRKNTADVRAARRQEYIARAEYHHDRAYCHVDQALSEMNKLDCYGSADAIAQLKTVQYHLSGYSMKMFTGDQDKAEGDFDDLGRLRARHPAALAHYHKIHDRLSDLVERGHLSSSGSPDDIAWLADMLSEVPRD